MILLEKNTGKNIPFYLNLLYSPLSYYFIELENKASKEVNIEMLINTSSDKQIQVFDFTPIATIYPQGTYNYKLYETHTDILPNEWSRVVEIGLLEIQGINNCNAEYIEYDSGDVDTVYYDCDNT